MHRRGKFDRVTHAYIPLFSSLFKVSRGNLLGSAMRFKKTERIRPRPNLHVEWGPIQEFQFRPIFVKASPLHLNSRHCLLLRGRLPVRSEAAPRLVP